VTKESRETQLNSLLKEAERCVLDLNLCVFGAATNGGLSAALLKVKNLDLLSYKLWKDFWLITYDCVLLMCTGKRASVGFMGKKT
jgi:hypothetical protein